jgi:S-adenosyl-L-methionine hydrolase (adenosine-forming)
MAIITLTTDLGLKDHYVSAVKGAILSQLPQATIVDISHQVPTYKIPDAAYILKNAFPDFPAGSIHIIGVKAEHNPQTPHVVVQSAGHFFVGADNGIFSLLLDTVIEKIVGLPVSATTFPTRDVFAKAACHLASGHPMEELGTLRTSLLERMPFRAASMGDMIRGTVIYIDSYGNVMTNIGKALFEQVGQNRSFSIEFARYEITRISNSYGEVPEGEILALFNAAGQLEIAMNGDRAGSMLNLKFNDTITVRFQ